jgi:hypothetical protein
MIEGILIPVFSFKTGISLLWSLKISWETCFHRDLLHVSGSFYGGMLIIITE